MVDGIGTAKLDTAMAAGREVRPELEGDMQGEINNLQGRAGELVKSLSGEPASNNRVVKTLEEGETDTIAMT
jgi:hypothetical protein